MTLPRVYPILDTDALGRRGCSLVEAAQALLDGGAGILQLRHKKHFSRELFEQAERVAELCRSAGATWIVNDRADMAKLLGAGVHLGQEDLPPSMVRPLVGDDAIIGHSTHNDDQLRAAADEPADYLAIGPIFSTTSKERPDPVVGIERLRQWRALTKRPLVAIGGITRENAAMVLEAGADSVAVISDILPEPRTAPGLRRRMEQWQKIAQS